jgi:hypothetical protein
MNTKLIKHAHVMVMALTMLSMSAAAQEEVQQGEAPWHVLVVNEHPGAPYKYCSGTIIASNTIWTSKQCLEASSSSAITHVSFNEIKIYVGNIDVYIPGTPYLTVKKIVETSPDVEGRTSYYSAALILNNDILLNNNANIINGVLEEYAEKGEIIYGWKKITDSHYRSVRHNVETTGYDMTRDRVVGIQNSTDIYLGSTPVTNQNKILYGIICLFSDGEYMAFGHDMLLFKRYDKEYNIHFIRGKEACINNREYTYSIDCTAQWNLVSEDPRRDIPDGRHASFHFSNAMTGQYSIEAKCTGNNYNTVRRVFVSREIDDGNIFYDVKKNIIHQYVIRKYRNVNAIGFF